ncbi:TPA: hypothetical protein DIV55_05850 [Patescibacteria group bacterium]|uniref:Membrane protein insertase, YidC/Oxa1 family n=1 Tax=Candidatus Gottesmanbacteria bacterium GW2011_GWA1_43_11 TaxID=1618436 RepID=A0A0G1ER94_9BACT|nr:MAG: Membrane protein insertase, YidC/Oxa1 family [Candidatus Gottesmanbacteria bacterium GW2011_GWA1_43_11]HCS79231.1 hypothetical protein [Patescibacteria group bacterium]
MTDPTIWNQLLIWPILNALMAFYKAFELVHVPGAFGFAIIALTLLINTLLFPLKRKQLESTQKLQSLKPQLDELSKKHKDDKVKLQQAQMELYKTAGVNPAGGCLPLLVQIPLFIALYNVFNTVLNGDAGFAERINTVLYHPALHITTLDLSFFGINLTTKPSEWQSVGVWLLLIPVVTAGLQYLQTKLMLPPAPKQKTEGDQMADMQRQMAIVTPIMFGYFAYSFPIGLAIYWNTFTLFGIIQQRQTKK